MFCDNSYLIEREDAIIIQVSEGRDSIDFSVLNAVSKYSFIIPRDYELADLCLDKFSFLLNRNGKEFTDKNVDQLLFFRHENAKFPRAGGRTKGPKRRQEKNNLNLKIKF
ncbi:DUF188 domain-containing protein [Geobacillus thermodenitrificans]|uniref:DUF188 domain-containing protein n=1 Tax=Geobacillus thermodenitrificans TaxID=33940 RepID=UPI0020A4340B|nr:DUF188 domain-containing protein [Geobacillus thermodenitrificans]MED3907275.1 DUF188 domain-containing protein [Geobacillus thermodenitrificans]